MQYLIDTDWVIDHLTGDEEVIARVKELVDDGIGMSIVSLAELYEGISGAYDRTTSGRALSEFLKKVDIVPLDDEICKIFGEERRRLRSIGMLIGDFDLLIGCSAKKHGLKVLTNNRRHFERIEGIQVESIVI